MDVLHLTKLLTTSKKRRTLVEKSLSVARVRVSRCSRKQSIDRHTTGDDSKGYFIKPTVILSKDPKSVTMVEEIFGPVITVTRSHFITFLGLTFNIQAYVFEDEDFDKTLKIIDTTTEYALTGAM